jgi:hypothetical protein
MIANPQWIPHPFPGGVPKPILLVLGVGEINFGVVVDRWGGCG